MSEVASAQRFASGQFHALGQLAKCVEFRSHAFRVALCTAAMEASLCTAGHHVHRRIAKHSGLQLLSGYKGFAHENILGGKYKGFA